MLENIGDILSILRDIAVIIGGVIAIRMTNRRVRALEEQAEVQRETQVIESFAKASELVARNLEGAEPALAVCGIAIMQQLIEKNPKRKETIMPMLRTVREIAEINDAKRKIQRAQRAQRATTPSHPDQGKED